MWHVKWKCTFFSTYTESRVCVNITTTKLDAPRTGRVGVKSFSRHQLGSPPQPHAPRHPHTIYTPSQSLCLVFTLTVSLSNSLRISLSFGYLYRTHIREWQHGLCRCINYRFYISYFEGEEKRIPCHRRHYNAIYTYTLYPNPWYPKPSFLFSTFNLSSIPTTFLLPCTLSAISFDVIVPEKLTSHVFIHIHTHTHLKTEILKDLKLTCKGLFFYSFSYILPASTETYPILHMSIIIYIIYLIHIYNIYSCIYVHRRSKVVAHTYARCICVLLLLA